jgi:GNAT superfamily N-acetyltransferase
MDEPRWTLSATPDPADVRFLEDQINAFNVARTGFDDARLLSILLRDEAGAIVAGLYGWTWGGCLDVRDLWVRADLRDRGYGSRLLAAAETEARARGCRVATLDTHSFQAPDFYRRHGYTEVGVVEGYPSGACKYWFRKALG